MTVPSLMSENLTAGRTSYREVEAAANSGRTRSVVANSSSEDTQRSTSRALRESGVKRIPFDIALRAGQPSISMGRHPEIEQTRNVGVTGSASARRAGRLFKGTVRSRARCRMARSVAVPKKRGSLKGVFLSFANTLSWSREDGADNGSENQSGGYPCRSVS
jgi:hypothetical protein